MDSKVRMDLTWCNLSLGPAHLMELMEVPPHPPPTPPTPSSVNDLCQNERREWGVGNRREAKRLDAMKVKYSHLDPGEFQDPCCQTWIFKWYSVSVCSAVDWDQCTPTLVKQQCRRRVISCCDRVRWNNHKTTRISRSLFCFYLLWSATKQELQCVNSGTTVLLYTGT